MSIQSLIGLVSSLVAIALGIKNYIKCIERTAKIQVNLKFRIEQCQTCCNNLIIKLSNRVVLSINTQVKQIGISFFVRELVDQNNNITYRSNNKGQ